MSSLVQRINIFSLYRAKLRICVSMGYTYGDWNTKFIYKNKQLAQKIKPKHIINQRNPGTIMWNNIRVQYKNNICETDLDYINYLIDSAFSWLIKINNVFGKYKQTPSYQKKLEYYLGKSVVTDWIKQTKF